MKVLVAGGAGYIGSVTTEMLCDEGHEVVVFDNLERGHQAAVDPRAKFLQGLLTNDVVDLEVGSGCQTLFLDNKGHVRADLDIWAEDDALILASDTDVAEKVLPDLRKYVLAAAVTLDDLREHLSVIGIVGPGAADLVTAAGGHVPAETPHAHVTVDLAGVAVRIARSSSLGGAGLEIHAPRQEIDAVWAALEAAGADAPPAYAKSIFVRRLERLALEVA